MWLGCEKEIDPRARLYKGVKEKKREIFQRKITILSMIILMINVFFYLVISFCIDKLDSRGLL